MKTSRKSWILLLIAGILGGCAEEIPEVEAPLRPVRTEVAQSRSEGEPITLAGVARAALESRLSFRVSGTIENMSVAIGDRVRRGQVLTRLDAVDYELMVDEAEAALAQAEAASRQAQADYSRVRALYENNNASKSDLDGSRAQAESAEAQVAAGAKRVEQARRQLDFTILRAPADGTIANVAAEVNENISAGQQIFLLTGGARAEVVMAVPEIAIPSVRRDQRVDIRFDALPGRAFVGHITEVGVAATGASSTFEVTAEVDDDSAQIRSGMAAEIAFTLDTSDRPSRLIVPLVSVGEDGDGRFVYIFEAQGQERGIVRRRGVEVGNLLHGGIEILSGLESGEVVVTAGVRRLVDGMEVAAPIAEGGAEG